MHSAKSPVLRIGLVEDNPADVLWFRLTLDSLRTPYHFAHWDTAAEALRALSIEQPDIVFVDLNLPGMSGEDLLERLRDAMAAGLPVCILTGSQLERKRLSLRFGLDAKRYIVKPISRDTFLDALSCFESARSLAEFIRRQDQSREKSAGTS